MKINGAGRLERVGEGKGRGTWRFRFNLGRSLITNKYQQSPWRTIHNASKADAVAAMAEYRAEIEGGLVLDADKVTFSQFAARYCAQRQALGRYAPKTLEGELNAADATLC